MPGDAFLSAPLWVVTVLHVATLTLHFLAMNFLVGGLVVTLFGRFPDRWNHGAVQRLTKLFPTLMAATVTLGVAPLLFAQLTYGRMLYAASIVSAWYWIAIPVTVIIVYYLLYACALAREGAPGKRWKMLLALVGLVFVSLVFSSVASLAERPDLQEQAWRANQSGSYFNDRPGDWVWRWLHMVTGALTVGALLVAVLGRDDEATTATSRKFFLTGMALAAVTGVGHLMTRGEAIKPFMRSEGIWALMISVLLTLAAIPPFLKRRYVFSGALIALSVAGMVVTRHALRNVTLPEDARPETLFAGSIQPQWDVFGIFIACFVVALGVVWWMLRAFFKRTSPVTDSSG